MTEIINVIQEFLTFSNIMVVVYALNLIISLGLIFLDSKSPTATMAWIMVLYIFPVVGLVMYLILSQNIARKQIFRMTENEQVGIDTLLSWQKETIRKGISG